MRARSSALPERFMRAAGLALCALSSFACAFDASTPAGAALASNRFGFDLYGRIKADDENLICSPASASVVLSMTLAGARTETEAQMTRVLHIDPAKRGETHASFGKVLAVLNGRDGADGVMLRVADRVWGQKKVSFESEFLATLRDRYRAPLEVVDFEGALEPARLAINHWAATETHDRIPELLAAGMLTAQTRLVLTTAVYFKGAWEKPFAPGATRERPFAGRKGEVKVQMMAQVETFKHTRIAGAQALELPYRGGLSMMVVLPDAANGLPAVERRLGAQYEDWLAALRPELVDLNLPRWTFTSNLPLNEPLIALGMHRAFGRGADFSGMTKDVRLYIDIVIQKAFVEVNETGTEAAAVTAVGMSEDSEGGIRPPEPIVFHADHPFLFLIRDTATGAILFVGRVASPSS